VIEPAVPLADISFNAIGLYGNNLQQIANPKWTVGNFLAAGSIPQCSYGGTVPSQVILTYGSGASF
jgi:hypothetical protein